MKKLHSFFRILAGGAVIVLFLSGAFGLGFQAIGVVVLMTAYRHRLAGAVRALLDEQDYAPPPPQSEKGRGQTAFHEAGHVVVGWVLSCGRTPVSASIRQDGDSNGRVTWRHLTSDAENIEEALNGIASCLGGIAGEKAFGYPETASRRNDLRQATDIATRMVCEWGFSGKLATRRYDPEDGLLTEEILKTINAEIDRFVQEGERRAHMAAKEHHDAIGRVAGLLLQHVTLDWKQLREAIGFDPAT